MIKPLKLEKIDIILIIIIVILLVVNIVIYSVNIGDPRYMMIQTTRQPTTTTTTTSKQEAKEEERVLIEVPRTEKEIIKKLSGLGERDRMEYYCGQYFKHLEKKEYEDAYDLLYPEFKEKYFPTYEGYEAYVKSFYPENWALEYEDITRQGDIYVLKLKILDIFGTTENEKRQRIVVKENNYNNFVISFQVVENGEGGQVNDVD